MDTNSDPKQNISNLNLAICKTDNISMSKLVLIHECKADVTLQNQHNL